MDNHFDRRERTIYVWMLERNVTDDQLYALFSKIGPIEKLIFKEYADGTPQHCLIVFRYVDSVLTAMSTLQGAELNGKPISLRPLRESTHAVLMPASTMYPTSSSASKERRTTVTSFDGLSEHSDDQPAGRKLRPSWDAGSSTGSASSCVWSPSAGDGGSGGLDSAIEKLAIDETRGNQGGSRSCASYSSISSGGLASPSHSLSPPPQQQQPMQHSQQQQLPYASSAIHGSLRKPWRPSRGPIPAPLLTPGGFPPRHQQQLQYPKEEYGSGGGGYGSHAAHHHSAGLAPPSLFSQIIPPSPGYGGLCSPSPYTGGHTAPHSSSAFFGGGGGASSPRPLFPELYKPATRGPQAPTGVFSPTAAPEEVLWRAQPPPPLMSPPCTGGGAAAGGTNWFDYGEYSVPQAYRGSGSEQQFAAAASAAAAAGQTPLSLGGMLPPNSPPIGQCTRFFDFSASSATLPHRLRHGGPPPPAHLGPSPYNHYRAPPPHSARPHAASPWATGGQGAGGGARCAPRAPRSAAPLHHSTFAWPAEFAGRF